MTDKELQEYRDKKAEAYRGKDYNSTGGCKEQGFIDGFDCAVELMRKENLKLKEALLNIRACLFVAEEPIARKHCVKLINDALGEK